MAASEEKELTEKQKRFCEEYVIDWNAARAARAAGYSENTAKEIGCQNLTKLNIREYIEECKKKTEKLAGVSALRVALEHKKVAFSSAASLRQDWHSVKEWDELTDEEKAIISEVEFTEKVLNNGEENLQVLERKLKYKTYDKHKSLDALSKMFGYNAPDKKDITSGGESLKEEIDYSKLSDELLRAIAEAGVSEES